MSKKFFNTFNTSTVLNLPILMLIFSFVSFAISPSVQSKPVITPKNFPKELKYRGLPIDPLCINRITIDEDAKYSNDVNLENCGLYQSGFKLETVDAKLIQRGFTGANFMASISKNSTLHGYSYYKPIGMIGDLYVIYSIFNDGRDKGTISTLFLMSRDKRSIKLEKIIASGDRCNGEIHDTISLKDDVLEYTISITPYDLIMLGSGKTNSTFKADTTETKKSSKKSAKMKDSQNAKSKIRPENDLAACPTCCIGIATFQYTQEHGSQLFSVKFDRFAGERKTPPAKYQACLNDLIYKQKEDHGLDMMPSELQDFADKFNRQCVKKQR